ncbi:MAG: GMC family oxidoreductase [Akkermansiaceae bacterium]|nr:GMC family oxidoreductase [Akkermansiaceae bacterium]
MIEDARTIVAGTCLEADLCIIGGGAAAITLALGYLNSGRSVIVIPGGGPNQSAFGIDLYRGAVSPQGSHEPLEENRLRMWGGTTTVWGGRCIPFDPIDFEKRDWMPNSGWPVGIEELNPYISRASEISEAGEANYDARSVFPRTQAEILTGFDDEDFASWPLERWSVPTDFSKRYKAELESAPNVRVLLHAHAIHLKLEGSGDSLESVKVACTPGQDFWVKSRDTVLACGALENARLLLAARDVLPEGIGNKNDLVGRYYQSHRFGVCGHVELKNPDKNFIYDFEKDAEGVYCRRRFWLTPEAQEKHQVCNVVGFFFRTVSGSSEHRNAMVSTVLLAKMILGGARKGPRRLCEILKDQRMEFLTHLKIVIMDGPSIFGQLAAVAYTRFFQKRRLPMVLPPKKMNRFPLFFQTEHAPLHDSRVLLDESSVDEFGIPRLEARIKFGEIDYRTITTYISLFKKRIEETGLGTFYLSAADQQFLTNPEKQNFNSNSHNIGTTRMSDRPESGVVDKDCKVYSVANLYVAGSSVFPTSGHANPTLMIIALTLRLADHLAAKHAR